MKRTYYREALFRYVTLFVVGPLLIGIGYTYYGLYLQHVEATKVSLSRLSAAASNRISSEINQLKFSLSSLARSETIAEIPINGFHAEHVLQQLQGFVESHPLVDAALIQNDNPSALQAYPVKALAVTSLHLQEITRQSMQQPLAERFPTLWLLSAEQFEPQLDNMPNYDHHLLMAAPLVIHTSSPVNPSRVTGVLYLKINLRRLLDVAMQADPQVSTNYQLLLGTTPFFNSSVPDWDRVIRQTDNTGVHIRSRFGTEEMQLIVQQDISSLPRQFLARNLFKFLLLLLVIALALLGMRRYLQNLNQPIADLVNICKKFTHGDFSATANKTTFREFDVVIDSLNAMAATIQEQVKSLRDAKQRAEQREQLKAWFLADMSHQIRTPLNGVIGLTELLHTTTLDQQQQTYVSNLLASGQALQHLINDIVDFTRIEAGQLAIEAKEFNLANLVDDVTEQFCSLAKAKGIEFHCLSSESNDFLFVGDPVRIRQVLSNLLSNAIKFTDAGRVTLEATVKPRRQTSRELHFRVTDTGKGLSEEEQTRLFERFVSSATTRNHGGAGLGLAISRELAYLMHGDISVSSQPGHGATFCFSVPVQRGRMASLSTTIPRINSSR